MGVGALGLVEGSEERDISTAVPPQLPIII